MDATSFEAVSALHELKYRNLRQDDRNFVLSTLEKHEKGEPLTKSDLLKVSDLLAGYQ